LIEKSRIEDVMKFNIITTFFLTLFSIGGNLILAQDERATMNHKTEVGKMNFTLQCPSFKDGEPIPEKFSCDGQDFSPALKWENPPPGTRSFALICDDPDAPVGIWVHWVIYNLPGSVSSLPENVDKKQKVLSGTLQGAIQGVNSWNRLGYGGPCPPPGSPHRYYFKLYALDIQITREGLDKKGLLSAMENHILGETQLMGRYQRRR
jgi:Raf kinase inhibitor-like YbhB/YbcL family protein